MSIETRAWAIRQWIHQLVLFTETGSGSCSMACSYCFLAKSGPHKVMSVETLRAAIDFLRQVAVKEPSLHFFGTEPLKQFGLIQEAHRYAPEMRISLTTNGHLLTRERVEWLTDHDCRVTIYSIDGDAHHNRHRVDRKGNPTWEIVARNLSMLLEYQSGWVTARGTWYPEDYDLVARFKALEELGAQSIQFVPVTNAPFDEEKTRDAYLALGDYYGWKKTPSKFINDMIDRMMDEDNVPQAGNGCGVGTHYWSVSPDGTLAMCQLGEEHPEWQIGSIWEGITNPAPLFAVSDRVNTFHTQRNPYPKQTDTFDCRRCHAYKHCMGVGWCAGWNRDETGDPIVPPDGYCAHLRGMVAACRIWAQKYREVREAKGIRQVLATGILRGGNHATTEEK